MADNKQPIKKHHGKLTKKSEIKPESVSVDDTVRLNEIRNLVESNNNSSLSSDLIICQIYMESRFDKDAHSQGSSARGLMQLLKAPIRELYRIENLKKPKADRKPEAELYREADRFHDSPKLMDEATNIQTGTAYLQALIDQQTKKGADDPISEAYKDYRGVRNGLYYKKISSASVKLKQNPESMQILRDMVK